MKFGAKTMALQKMLKKGFPVPAFLAFTASEKIDIQEIKQKLPALKYAVRSSALIEDNSTSSMAGQFMTKLKLDLQDIPQAADEIIKHAKTQLNVEPKDFSIIVQEYIPAETAGVLFTRNPLGTREILLEFANTVGEEIVSGKLTPKQYSLYWNENPKKFPELIKVAQKIESLFGHPQDIEWLVNKGKIYILQARPITTINEDQYAGIKYLDRTLPENDFLYEKTEISEIAEHPSQEAFNLLQKIYANNGPVQRVYEKYGIKYRATNFLRLVDTHLYIDKEAEIQSILPAYSYLNKRLRPKISRIKGLWTSFKNFIKLSGLKTNSHKEIANRLRKSLNTSNDFFQDYELIFEINLLAEKSMSSLKTALKSENISLSEVLTHDFGFQLATIQYDSSGFQGNSLEIADKSKFKSLISKPQSHAEIAKWIEGLGQVKKKLYLPIIEAAQQFSRLREYGRHLTVKHISLIKKEIEKPVVRFDFPPRLSSIIVKEKRELLGVSPGKAKGILSLEATKGDILYTKILSPNLTTHFDKISGIVSEQGGMLSHLAIMAREHGIPVISGFNLQNFKIQPGDEIEINASKGSIKKV